MVVGRDTGGYLSGLTRWRQGDVTGWAAWVADAISRSAEQVVNLVAEAEDMRRCWEGLLAEVRSDSAARRHLDIRPRYLVVTAPMVAELLDVPAPTARAAIETLAACGILQPLELRPVRPGRPAQWWMAEELVSVAGRWSR